MSKYSLEKAMRNAKASLELSGVKAGEEHTELVRKVLAGELTNEEFHEEAKRLVKEKGGHN